VTVFKDNLKKELTELKLQERIARLGERTTAVAEDTAQKLEHAIRDAKDALAKLAATGPKKR
jgi:hypothetical protein